MGCKDGAVLRALASHQCQWPGFDPRLGEFVGSLLSTDRFFSGRSGFLLPSITNNGVGLIR